MRRGRAGGSGVGASDGLYFRRQGNYEKEPIQAAGLPEFCPETTSAMEIASTAPHDFYLTLDVDEYFEEEYDPMAVFRRGFVRPLVLEERDVLAVVQWNESAEEPVFHVEFPDHRLTSAEEAQAERALRRTFGCDLDLEGFY